MMNFIRSLASSHRIPDCRSRTSGVGVRTPLAGQPTVFFVVPATKAHSANHLHCVQRCVRSKNHGRGGGWERESGSGGRADCQPVRRGFRFTRSRAREITTRRFRRTCLPRTLRPLFPDGAPLSAVMMSAVTDKVPTEQIESLNEAQIQARLFAVFSRERPMGTH